jgi:hypothetical protein
VAGLIHIVAAESEKDGHFLLKMETPTHGHVLLRKSESWSGYLARPLRQTDDRAATGLNQRLHYVTQTVPLLRASHKDNNDKVGYSRFYS